MNEFDRIQHEIESDERWLAGFESPEPSAETLANVKLAVRSELRRSAASSTGGTWRAWQGAVASAAVIAFGVALAWYSMPTDPQRGRLLLAEGVEVDSQFAEDVGEELLAYRNFDDELDALESWGDGDEMLDVGSLYDAFEDALASDGDSQTPTGTSGLSPTESESVEVTA